MADKAEFMKHLQKDYKRYWYVRLFKELGYKRVHCSNCRKFFWTLTEQKTCNDATCRTYDFIGSPLPKKPLDYFETWKAIEKFFVKNNHTSIKPYPVVCRWIPNLYFTVAGIVDFLRVDNGNVSFDLPANPLILTQPCLRFNDVVNTGINGKSYTCFGMIQQTSLYDSKQGYWKDECIDLDWKLLTEVFSIPDEEIVFIEDAWLGPTAFGSSLEYHVQGLELGNAVFTEFAGTVDSYREMKDKVIDMGGGHERFTWFTQGTPTSYDAVFGDVLDKLKKACNIDYDKEFFLRYSKIAGSLNADEGDLSLQRRSIAEQLKVSVEELETKVLPLEAIYAIADHTRALAFAIAGAGLPSNIGGGYNLRVILRRALSFINKFNFPIRLEDVATWHINYLKKLFPDLKKHEDDIVKILEVEERRYKETVERSKKIIEGFSGRKIPEEELITLYESQGITPEQLGLETPQNFYQKITEKHMGNKTEEEKFPYDLTNLPATRILYHDKPPKFEFKAKILKVFDDSFVVLDQTAFYPESGGQKYDTGYINNAKVTDVMKIGSGIVYKVEGNVREGTSVEGKIDRERRTILRKHHDSIHIINGVVHKVLGSWAHQHGTEKDIDKARIDITHYEALTDDQVEAIENMANEIVEKDLPITKTLMDRSDAEKKYGFEIYTGGYVPSKQIRVVEIGNGFDIEACAGTHGDSTGDIGYITILRTKRIADGLVRIEIKSGDVALEYLKEKERILQDVAKKLDVKEEDVPKAVEKLFETWKSKRKQLKK
jgi:alanyl-tRNA synthetase